MRQLYMSTSHHVAMLLQVAEGRRHRGRLLPGPPAHARHQALNEKRGARLKECPPPSSEQRKGPGQKKEEVESAW
jgi:hypothetical protein